MTNSKDKKRFGTPITPFIENLINMQPPKTEREFCKWKNQFRDAPLLDKLKILTMEISEYEKLIKKPHTYPWYYTEFLELLKHEKVLIKELLEQEKEYSNKISDIPKQFKTIGFKTNLDEKQIEQLFEKAKDEYIETDLQNLKDLLNGKECKPIIWKYYTREQPNKLALTAFILTIFKEPKEPKTIGKKYFINKRGKPIIIGKPSRKNPNHLRYVDKFSEMIKK